MTTGSPQSESDEGWKEEFISTKDPRGKSENYKGEQKLQDQEGEG